MNKCYCGAMDMVGMRCTCPAYPLVREALEFSCGHYGSILSSGCYVCGELHGIKKLRAENKELMDIIRKVDEEIRMADLMQSGLNRDIDKVLGRSNL